MIGDILLCSVTPNEMLCFLKYCCAQYVIVTNEINVTRNKESGRQCKIQCSCKGVDFAVYLCCDAVFVWMYLCIGQIKIKLPLVAV